MKNKIALSLLFVCVISFGYHSLPVKSEAKFVSGYTDGFISTYAIIESNGVKYKTDEMGPRTNMNLWNQLSEDDKRQVMKYYWSPNTRKADFGAGSGEMASWANDVQGWSKVVEALKQKRANKNYPDLKAYYDKPFEMPTMPNVSCTEQIQNCDAAKEAQKLYVEITANQQAGQAIYQKLVEIKWEQVGVAVKGISANLIPVIVDNFMMPHIAHGAHYMSDLLAQLYQFGGNLKDFAQNSPNDAAAIIKKLDTLCDMMETDARTAITIVEKDKQRLQELYNQLAKLCEEDVKNKQKADEAKAVSLQSLMHAPTADTGLSITSRAEKQEDRTAEITAQARAIYISLNSAMGAAYTDAKSEFDGIAVSYSSVKSPTPIKVCYDYYPQNVDSPCFGMSFSVKEIKDWEKEFPRGIAEIQAKLENAKSNLQKAVAARASNAARIKSIQSRINELVKKYGGYLGYGFVDDNIDDKIGYYNTFIDSLEKDISSLELALAQATDAEKIVKAGLQKRIEFEKNEIRPYSSLEANFINSLSQIRDAVYKLDQLYASEEVFILNKKAHKAYMNLEKIKEIRTKISLLPTQAERDREIQTITDRLKEKQKEESHQIKRLIAGQNNGLYDCQKLGEFLDYYTGGLVHTITAFAKIKQDVKEVAGVSLKDIYYDIVEDWQNGDYMLWMVGNGSTLRWFIDPETLRVDFDSVIEQLNGKNQFYNSLDVILNEVKNKKSDLLAMDSDSFGKKYNEYSGNAYKIIQDSTGRGEETEQVQKKYINILNILTEINSVILTRERVKEALPVLQKDINDAKNLLASTGDGNIDYDGMAARLQHDIREGSEAYYAKEDKALAPLFDEINNLIPQLQNAIKQGKVDAENKKIQKINEFYASFKQAYESKSESQVVSFISNDWESVEGTTVSDLEENLRRTFNIFDNLSYNLSNLTIIPLFDNSYRVSYDVEIIGQNYEKGLKHVEKSSVTEQVNIDGRGKVSILKTLNGRFWYIK